MCLADLISGGWIFLGPGTYNIYQQITSSHNANIIGSGRGTTVLVRQVIANRPTVILSGSNITVAQLTIDGNYPRNTSCVNAEIAFGGTNIQCVDVEVKDFNFIGIQNKNYGVIRDCIITGPRPGIKNVSQYGIWSVLATAYTEITNCKIQYCSVNAVFGGGITIMENCYIANNAIAGGGQVGAGYNCKLTKVNNCTFDSGLGGDSGIEMDTHEWIVTNNRINGQSHWGIVTNANVVTRAIVENNIVTNCGQGAIGYAGIFINGAQTNFLIQGNVCVDDQKTPTQKYGIQIARGASDHYIIKNNTCRGNITAQILDQGTGNDKIVSDNIVS